MVKRASKAGSGILTSVRMTAAGLHRAGVIDQKTIREFGTLCRTPVTLDEIKR